jgi:Fe-S oxidoreductase
MLPLSSRIGFFLFAVVMLGAGAHGFYRAYLRICRGRPDTDLRTEHWPTRLRYALKTTLTQQRTFRKRGIVSFFHSFIFYGFTFYLLVNLVDALAGYGFEPLKLLTVLQIFGTPGIIVTAVLVAGYVFLADLMSFLVLIGVIALVIRRFLLPARRNFRFNDQTLLHERIRRNYISRDSAIVSAFILFHVGSRALGAGARIAAMPMDKFNAAGNDPLEPFGSMLAHLFTQQNAHAWQVFGYWGALGSVLAFLAYFPYSKHIHIFAAPLKYFFARTPNSGVLPLVEINLEAEEQNLGAEKLEDLSWPRLLDAYACIQCNRCQDVCPATATGKSLSPAALEINKRMELNVLALHRGASSFEQGAPSPHPLLSFALTPEAAWACTTCGACMEVCPVQDEQMLDIIDIRRHQVMIKGEFPAQLQTAFRGMERAKNPWGISHDKRMAWTEGLTVRTTEENPTPDVLYWVGCAASYDPQAQKTARAVVQLLDHAGVDFAVLGKKECCTGDSARRGGNELLYRELADQNVSTLNQVKPKLILASCPHCMNSLGNEYKQIGGDYKVMHHTEYLESLVASGKLQTERSSQTITYHDPCYLGRHNGVYDAPRNLLRVLGSEIVELERNRSNSFCCGAGGAQFWKEEEPGTERVSENRFKEVQRVLDGATGERTLAVGCPFCKSMLGSTPSKEDGAAIAIKDVAELLLEGVLKQKGIVATTALPTTPEVAPQVIAVPVQAAVSAVVDPPPTTPALLEPALSSAETPERKKWQPKTAAVQPAIETPANRETPQAVASAATSPERKKWQPKATSASSPAAAPADENIAKPEPAPVPPVPPVERKKWQPKSKS